MMQEERDRMLLAILEPYDLAKLLCLVEEIVAEELVPPAANYLNAVADAFDRRGGTLPDEEKVIAMQVAAALRLRAAGGVSTH
jgi:hypothetical protein